MMNLSAANSRHISMPSSLCIISAEASTRPQSASYRHYIDSFPISCDRDKINVHPYLKVG